jgi:hypothetical protein
MASVKDLAGITLRRSFLAFAIGGGELLQVLLGQ